MLGKHGEPAAHAALRAWRQGRATMGSTEKTHPGRSARAGGEAALVWAYCWSHVLPIWEQWTSGDLVMRRALEATANPEVAGDSARSDLIDAAFMLFQDRKSVR